MAKLIDYDVTGVEESQGGGTGVKVKPGVHIAEIVRCTHRTENRRGEPANDLEVALSFGEEFDWIFTYVGLNQASDWKLKEFIRAVGMKEKGKLDPDKMVGKVVRVKVNTGEWEGNYRPEAGRLMPGQRGDKIGGSVALSASENGDEPASALATAAPEYADGFEASRESDPEVGSYEDWEVADLEAEASDRGVTIPGGRGNKKDKIITALRAEDAVAEGTSEDGAGGDDASDDDYDTWDHDQLVQEWEERDLGDLPTFRGRGAAERIDAAIREALREDDNENPFDG